MIVADSRSAPGTRLTRITSGRWPRRRRHAEARTRAAGVRWPLRARLRRRERVAELERRTPRHHARCRTGTRLERTSRLRSRCGHWPDQRQRTARAGSSRRSSWLPEASSQPLGSALAAVAGNPWLALVGIAIAGLGTSVCAPTIISMAGAWAGPERRAGAISTVTTIAYLGFLLGPAAVGAASSVWSLPTALGGVAVLAVVVAVLGPVAGRAGDEATNVKTWQGGGDRTEVRRMEREQVELDAPGLDRPRHPDPLRPLRPAGPGVPQ